MAAFSWWRQVAEADRWTPPRRRATFAFPIVWLLLSFLAGCDSPKPVTIVDHPLVLTPTPVTLALNQSLHVTGARFDFTFAMPQSGSDGNSESISFPVYAGDMWLFVPFCVPLSAPRGFCGYGCDKVGPLPPIHPSSDGFFSNSDSWYCNYGCGKGVNNPYVEPMSQRERTATKAAIAAAAVTAPITRIFGGALIESATGTAAGTVAGGLVSCSQ